MVIVPAGPDDDGVVHPPIHTHCIPHHGLGTHPEAFEWVQEQAVILGQPRQTPTRRQRYPLRTYPLRTRFHCLMLLRIAMPTAEAAGHEPKRRRGRDRKGVVEG